MSPTLARNGDPRSGTAESPDNSPEGGAGGGATCWWAPLAAMGCFGSASSKQNNQGSGSDSEDKVSQKKRSDAITKQLQKDKQVSVFKP